MIDPSFMWSQIMDPETGIFFLYTLLRKGKMIVVFTNIFNPISVACVYLIIPIQIPLSLKNLDMTKF